MVTGRWNTYIVLIILVFFIYLAPIGVMENDISPFNESNDTTINLDNNHALHGYFHQEYRGGKGLSDKISPHKLQMMQDNDRWYSQINPQIAEKILATRNDFHSYSEMTYELQTIATTYPTITCLYDLGASVQGRTIWGLKITDNPNLEENEPEVRIAGLHHGNEQMSAELPLLLAWHLVENYSHGNYISGLINETEIWIIPMVNPDGREATPPTRYNANGVDLNRDYGYMWDGEGNSPSPFSQPETQAIRNHALDNNFVLSLSFHTSGDIVNYIWNYKSYPTADDAMVVDLSYLYGSFNDYWVVRGYNWYQTRGDTNDFSYGCRGDIDWTIEVQNNNIPQAWTYNKEAMMEIIDAADMGLTGVVTDNMTGQPLAATIWVEEAYWPCFTDPKIGDYHRLLFPGNYTVHFLANGYREKIVNVVVTEGDEPTVLNATLDQDSNYFSYQVCWCNYYDPYSYPNNFQNNPTEAISALGPPDNISASLGVGGEIVLDMGQTGEIFNGLGNDFTIFEGDDTQDGYNVFASTTWRGPWIQIGSGMGTTSFDLNDAGMTHARFIKIQDDGGGDPYENNPGIDLDALQVLNTFNIYIDGIDVSAWQGLINWSTVYQSGYRFSYVKATEGIGWTDPYFQNNMNNGSAAGMLMGAYHYATPEQDDAIPEAEYFLQIAGEFITQGYLRPVLDLEQGSELGMPLLSNWVHDWMTTIENETGVQPLIYVNSNYANNFLNDSVSNYDLWIAHWTYNPYVSPDIGIWDDWKFWQYSNQGSVPGITGDVDLDVFNGNLSELENLVITYQDLPYTLYKGWNLITIPTKNSWTTETLGQNITGCNLVLRFNASRQEFETHVVGVSYDDYPIQNGAGYFVRVSNDTILTLRDVPITTVNVTVYNGWNTIGWYHDYPSSAQSLGENTSASLVLMYNATTQNFRTYVMNSGYDNFTITRGMAVFIQTSETGYWQGEG